MHKGYIIPVPHGSILYHQLTYSSPNRSKKQNKKEPHKRTYCSEKRRFREKDVRRMSQKQKRIRRKE